MTGTLRERIERYSQAVPAGTEPEARATFAELKAALNAGTVRAAERGDTGEWIVHRWVKAASISEMKERYRDDQRHKILAEKMQYKLISEVEITPREVQSSFNGVPSDSLPYFMSEMQISELIIVPQVNEYERVKALNKITELRQKIVSGAATFEDIASKNSQDPGSGLRGGDLGYAKRGVYVPEFEATVFSMAKDEISEIIETEFGFHIIQLMERRGNSVRARHVLIKPEITSRIWILLKTVWTLCVLSFFLIV